MCLSNKRHKDLFFQRTTPTPTPAVFSKASSFLSDIHGCNSDFVLVVSKKMTILMVVWRGACGRAVQGLSRSSITLKINIISTKVLSMDWNCKPSDSVWMTLDLVFVSVNYCSGDAFRGLTSSPVLRFAAIENLWPNRLYSTVTGLSPIAYKLMSDDMEPKSSWNCPNDRELTLRARYDIQWHHCNR